MGDPSSANAELGERIAQDAVGKLVALIRVLER